MAAHVDRAGVGVVGVGDAIVGADGQDVAGDRDRAQGGAVDGAAVLQGRAAAVRGGLLISGLVHDQHDLVCTAAPERCPVT